MPMFDTIDAQLRSSIKQVEIVFYVLEIKSIIIKRDLLCGFKRTKNANSKMISSQPNIDALNDASVGNFNQIGPLNAFTLESVEILKESQFRIEEGKDLRAKSKILMKECIENAKNSGQLVNEAFLKRIEDTLILSVSPSLLSSTTIKIASAEMIINMQFSFL
jgi:hypothetical protein